MSDNFMKELDFSDPHFNPIRSAWQRALEMESELGNKWYRQKEISILALKVIAKGQPDARELAVRALVEISEIEKQWEASVYDSPRSATEGK